jgi:hypothetical protein
MTLYQTSISDAQQKFFYTSIDDNRDVSIRGYDAGSRLIVLPVYQRDKVYQYEMFRIILDGLQSKCTYIR